MIIVNDDNDVQAAEYFQAVEVADPNFDENEMKYDYLVMVFEVLRRVVLQETERHMRAFFILINNDKEAFDHIESKDQINHQYEEIPKVEPSYTTMEFNMDR
jgi:hypothetical protein